jgi:hypothetical protein
MTLAPVPPLLLVQLVKSRPAFLALFMKTEGTNGGALLTCTGINSGMPGNIR